MSSPDKLAYTQASIPVLRWLTDGGPVVPAQIHNVLLSQIFVGQRAVLMGVVNGLIVNIVALCLAGGAVFMEFIAADLVIAAVRLAVVHRALHAAAHGRRTPTDAYLGTVICWCGLQGMIAFVAMRSGVPALQIISATTIVAVIGPICVRYFPAPRLAILLICLCDLPFVAGAGSSRDPWLLVIVLQTPLFYFGCKTIIRQLRDMSVNILRSQQDSEALARHDALTGLLNRAGLIDVLTDLNLSGSGVYTLFYLDLDGFKTINDTYGHAGGDNLLMDVAKRLRAVTRASDTIARLGGDEFVIIAPNLSAAASHQLADSVIRRVTDQRYELHEGVWALIGISIGFACSPEDGSTLKILQHRADSALYEAKRAGKGVQRRFRQPVALTADAATGG